MFDSVLSSAHFYYIVYFDSSQVKNIDQIINFFPVNKQSELIEFERSKVVHLQLEIGQTFGSETLLTANFTKEVAKIKYFWYDLYLGTINISKESFYFICYPYNKLGKYIEGFLTANKINKIVYKPDVNAVLDYIKVRGAAGYSKIESDGLVVDITKYSAEVKDETNKINIIGTNPLNSRAYEILYNDPEIRIIPISLKLKCIKDEVGSLEISFDRIGNFRFWIRKFSQKLCLPVLPYTLEFFKQIEALNKSNFFNSLTLLEDE